MSATPIRKMIRTAALCGFAFLAMSASGCDPGYHYQPVDSSGKQLSQWSQTIEGVQFSAKSYGTLIGASYIYGHLEIVNRSNKEVLVLGGQLLTDDRTIKARVNEHQSGREERTVAPGRSRSVDLSWDFGASAHEVLGPKITWVWRVQIGAAEHDLRIPMQRTSG